MNEMDLMDALTDIRSYYIIEAAPKEKKKSRLLRLAPKLAAAAAVLAVLLLFLQTGLGTAAAEYLRERVTSLIETLFPPKVIVTIPEGAPEANLYQAQGQEPEDALPGFAIYVDREKYELVQEGEDFYIRPLGYDPESKWSCDMVIRQVAEAEPMTLAQQVHDEMAPSWKTVSEIWRCSQPVGLAFDASQGLWAESRQEGHYFVSNGMGGSFHIILRYFLEATEGHGTRMRSMLDTFRVIAPQGGTYIDTEQTLLEATRQEVAFVKAQADQRQALLSGGVGSQAEINTWNLDCLTLWLGGLDRVWNALEQTLTEAEMESLTREQLDWSVNTQASMQSAAGEYEGGTLASAVYCGMGAQELERRVEVLMMYLEGTLPIAQGAAGVPDAGELAEDFARAYFGREDLTPYLSQGAAQDGPWPFPEAEVIYTTGTDNWIVDMAHWGQLNASAAFRETPQADSLSYLSMTLVWEGGNWRVSAYGLEK